MAEQTLKEKTAKGLFWGGISNGMQQLLGVLIGIVLLKNLTPDDYGMVGMLAIFTAIASTIQESGFTAALTNRPEFKAEDYNSVFWFNLVVGGIIYLILFFTAPLIAYFYRQPELLSLSRVLFLSILIGSFGIAHNAVLFRKLMVKERAKIDITSTSLAGIVGIYMAVNGFGYWSLVIQTLIYSLLGTILRWFYSPWRPVLQINFSPIKEMFGFGIKMLLSSIIAQVQGNIFSVLLGRFSTKADVGYFSQGVKWASMGTQVVNGMVFSVAQPIFAQTNKDKLRQAFVFRKIIRFISFISFPCMLGLAFISKDFISVINQDFIFCVPILQLYCIWGAFTPILMLYAQIVVAYGRSDFYFWISVVFAIIQISLVSFVLQFGIYWMAFSIVLSSYIYLLVWHIFVATLLPIKFFQIVKDIIPYLVASLFVFTVAYFLTKNICNIYKLLILKIFISVLLYICIMKIFKSVIFDEVVSFIWKK